MDTSPTPAEFRFHQYRLLPAQRLLLDGTRPVKLGSRAFDMLQVLIERRDRVVGKHELMDLVWPKLVVEENNLQVQVMALRKLFGHGAIATVPGRGYRFTLAVESDEPARVPALPAGLAGAEGLPALVGRDEELRTLLGLIDEHPVVTVAGAGGIGKTRLAQSAAHACAPRRGDGVWWIELAGLSDPALVPIAVGQALGLQLDSQADANGAVARALQGKAALLVLDNAEHLLDAVAALVATLRERAASVKLLVTSQEVMRGLDEQVFRPGPLGLPPSDDLAVVRASGAVALFVARAQQADPRFTLHEHNGAAVADICRRLDGIPLAIELAAARVPLLGVEGVRARLHDRFNLLTAGARAVMRRHQTLRAALDWSHALLSETEQQVLRRLAVFAGGFTLDAAQEVAAGEGIDAWDVLDLLGALVDKSLVVAEGEPLPRYRLLETTRLYALERLAEAGETEATLLRHAQWFTALAEHCRAARAERRPLLDAERDNLLHALSWCDRDGDDTAAALGLRLAAALLNHWPARGLIGVGLAATRRALDRAATLPADDGRCSALRGMAHLLLATRQFEACKQAAGELLALAESLGSQAYVVAAQWVLGLLASTLGDWPTATGYFETTLAYAQRENKVHLECSAIAGLVGVLSGQGRLAEAETSCEDLLRLSRVAGDGLNLVQSLQRTAWVALQRGATDRAARALAEALPWVRSESARLLSWGWCSMVGSLAARRWHWVVAVRLRASVTRFALTDGVSPDEDDLQSRSADADMDAARAALGDAAYERAWQAGTALSETDALACAAAELGLQP